MKKTVIKSGDTIGIVGGGQLARMMCFEAHKLGYKTHIFSDKADSPAFQVTSAKTFGEYGHKKFIDEFIEKVSVVTFEFENLPHDTLGYIEKKSLVRPGTKALYISQDRIREKNFINNLNIATTDYREIQDFEEFKNAVTEFGYSAVLKTSQFGYDGKGQFYLKLGDNLEQIYDEAFALNVPLILEKKVCFVKELSVVVVRDIYGDIACYDIAHNLHQDGILRKTLVPADVLPFIKRDASNIASKIITALDYVGVMAVELFLTNDNKLLVNEIAPRPHNSGHFTIDACYHNQFEQGIRAVAGLPVLSTKMHSEAVMVNLIGEEISAVEKLATRDFVKIHDYDKDVVKEGRKMGHYTVLKPGCSF